MEAHADKNTETNLLPSLIYRLSDISDSNFSSSLNLNDEGDNKFGEIESFLHGALDNLKNNDLDVCGLFLRSLKSLTTSPSFVNETNTPSKNDILERTRR